MTKQELADKLDGLADGLHGQGAITDEEASIIDEASNELQTKGYVDPVDETKELSKRYNNDNSPGGMAWSGIGGFHTLFRHDDGLQHALTTAFHSAIEFGLDELFFDASLIENEYGELTPETARKELEQQLYEFYNLSPDSWFVQQICEAYEERLERLDSALRKELNEELSSYGNNGSDAR